jgi:hypothetical protein
MNYHSAVHIFRGLSKDIKEKISEFRCTCRYDVEILKAGSRNLKLGSMYVVLLIVLVLPSACPPAQAENDVNFTSKDTFSIPASNGFISFAVNGTYTSASLDNDVWTFVNLQLDNLQRLDKLGVSAQNSNVTIIAYSMFDTRFRGFRGALLSYKVEGQGKQSFNIGVPLEPGEWSVLLGEEFKSEGDGWSVAPDATVTVTAAKSNVTIFYFGFPESFNPDANQPFYIEHSVAIAVTAALAITVTFALAVKRKTQNASDKNRLATTRNADAVETNQSGGEA